MAAFSECCSEFELFQSESRGQAVKAYLQQAAIVCSPASKAIKSCSNYAGAERFHFKGKWVIGLLIINCLNVNKLHIKSMQLLIIRSPPPPTSNEAHLHPRASRTSSAVATNPLPAKLWHHASGLCTNVRGIGGGGGDGEHAGNPSAPSEATFGAAAHRCIAMRNGRWRAS